jgi:hypothetical protein
VRHIDYDIDYLAGTLRFREPILSRSSGLNPQFIIAEYEVDGVGKRVNNAGGRVEWQSPDQKLQIAATAIHDETDTDKTNLVGADVRYRPTANTELRAEFAATNGKANAGSATTDAGGASAVLLEAEHHGSKLDVLAYYRRQSARFGVGQTNRSEIGTEKFGLDGRYRLTDKLSISAIGYQEDYIETGARRIAGSTELEYRDDKASLRAGITHADDKLADGTTNKSTLARVSLVLQAGPASSNSTRRPNSRWAAKMKASTSLPATVWAHAMRSATISRWSAAMKSPRAKISTHALHVSALTSPPGLAAASLRAPTSRISANSAPAALPPTASRNRSRSTKNGRLISRSMATRPSVVSTAAMSSIRCSRLLQAVSWAATAR